MTIQDFEQIKVVGRGAFSRVVLARKKDSGRLYAIKILHKDKLTSESQIMTERKVLEQLSHTFLIKLHWAFQSNHELFFVTDICTGGELFYHMRQQRRFSEKLSKFYMCEILLGFQYLHDHDIVYRDVKPENFLVDMDGHIKIADFGLSRVIRQDELSHTFCGSPEYLSPEMLLRGDGHDRRLDIYCLGVLLYEMLTGLPPFYDEKHEVMYDKILNEDVVFDQQTLTHQVRDLLSKMLEKDPTMRQQSISEVMAHAWFRDVDWDKVKNKQVKPLLIPDLSISYFEKEVSDGEQSSLNISYLLHDNLGRSQARRQSFYLHSTLQMQSQMDEHTSFIRSPSQMRQLFDQSVSATHMNESAMFQNLQTSVIDGNNILNRSQLQQHIRRGPRQQNSSQFLSINSPQEGPISRIRETFSDFAYSCPPQAELQVLRILESIFTRQKKNQLEYARAFRAKLLVKNLEGNVTQGAISSIQVSRSSPDHSHVSIRKGYNIKMSSQALGQVPKESKKNKLGILSQSGHVVEDLVQPQHNQPFSVQPKKLMGFKPTQLSIVSREQSMPANQILSSFQNEQLASKTPFFNKNCAQTESFAETYGEKADEVVNKMCFGNDDSQLLQNVINEIPSASRIHSHVRVRSKTYSLESFRTNPRQMFDQKSDEAGSEKSSIFLQTMQFDVDNLGTVKTKQSAILNLHQDLSQIEFQKCYSARLSHSGSSLKESESLASSSLGESVEEIDADEYKAVNGQQSVKQYLQDQNNFEEQDPNTYSAVKIDLLKNQSRQLNKLMSMDFAKIPSMEEEMKRNVPTPQRNGEQSLFKGCHQSLKEVKSLFQIEDSSNHVKDQRFLLDQQTNANKEYSEQSLKLSNQMSANQSDDILGQREHMLLQLKQKSAKNTGNDAKKILFMTTKKNRTDVGTNMTERTESTQVAANNARIQIGREKRILVTPVINIDTGSIITSTGAQDVLGTPQRHLESDSGLTFGGIPCPVSVASESDLTQENNFTASCQKVLNTKDSKKSSNFSAGMHKTLALNNELTPVKEKLKRAYVAQNKKEELTNFTDHRVTGLFAKTSKGQSSGQTPAFSFETSVKKPAEKQRRLSGKLTPSKQSYGKLSHQSKHVMIKTQTSKKESMLKIEPSTPSMLQSAKRPRDLDRQLDLMHLSSSFNSYVMPSNTAKAMEELKRRSQKQPLGSTLKTKQTSPFIEDSPTKLHYTNFASHKMQATNVNKTSSHAKLPLPIGVSKMSQSSEEDSDEFQESMVADETESRPSEIYATGSYVGQIRPSGGQAFISVIMDSDKEGRKSPSKAVRESHLHQSLLSATQVFVKDIDTQVRMQEKSLSPGPFKRAERHNQIMQPSLKLQSRVFSQSPTRIMKRDNPKSPTFMKYSPQLQVQPSISSPRRSVQTKLVHGHLQPSRFEVSHHQEFFRNSVSSVPQRSLNRTKARNNPSQHNIDTQKTSISVSNKYVHAQLQTLSSAKTDKPFSPVRIHSWQQKQKQQNKKMSRKQSTGKLNIDLIKPNSPLGGTYKGIHKQSLGRIYQDSIAPMSPKFNATTASLLARQKSRDNLSTKPTNAVPKGSKPLFSQQASSSFVSGFSLKKAQQLSNPVASQLNLSKQKSSKSLNQNQSRKKKTPQLVTIQLGAMNSPDRKSESRNHSSSAKKNNEKLRSHDQVSPARISVKDLITLDSQTWLRDSGVASQTLSVSKQSSSGMMIQKILTQPALSSTKTQMDIQSPRKSLKQPPHQSDSAKKGSRNLDLAEQPQTISDKKGPSASYSSSMAPSMMQYQSTMNSKKSPRDLAVLVPGPHKQTNEQASFPLKSQGYSMTNLQQYPVNYGMYGIANSDSKEAQSCIDRQTEIPKVQFGFHLKKGSVSQRGMMTKKPTTYDQALVSNYQSNNSAKNNAQNRQLQ